MGVHNSIHDIPLDNAVPSSSKKNNIIINTLPIKTSYTELKKEFTLNTKEIEADDNTTTTRFTKRNLYKFSDFLLRKNIHQKNIMDNISTEKENFKILKVHNQTKEDAILINECIQKHFFMKYLNKQAISKIIEEMSLVEIEQNNFIFKQGTIGNYFYILKSGSAELLVNHQLIKILKKGESFGELALLHDAPRSGSIKAISNCLLWTMERKNFRKIIEHINKITYEENLQFIDSVSVLSHMEQYQKTILCSHLVLEEFNQGRLIVKKGEFSSCLYIIKTGEVECIDENGIVIRHLKKGEHFGERSILIDKKRTLDVIAKTFCICYSISISYLKSMLGEKYRSFLFLNFMKSAFQKSELFNQLNTYFLEEIFQYFEAVNLGNDNVAFPIKHNKSSKIVIIIDGNLINVSLILFKIIYIILISQKLIKLLHQEEIYYLKKIYYLFQMIN